MASVVFENGMVFDGQSAELSHSSVRIEGEQIVEVSEKPIAAPDATRIDLGGRTLMPGLIDAHVHCYCPEVDIHKGDRQPITLVAHRARHMLESSLRRGFTCVRDTGGGDYGLFMAIERGLLKGPRLNFCGKALSQTGGHGDMRNPDEEDLCTCGAGYAGHLSRVADGVDEIRRAIRDELRRGAHFIKAMGSGGVASPADDLTTAQYSDEEIRAAVDETQRHGTYVTTHIHPDAALRRAIELGVPCIEHGTLASEDTARLAAERNTAIVPTLAVVKALARYGAEQGLPKASLEKLELVEPFALRSVELFHRAGVRVGFGTDLIGNLDRHQHTEFEIRSEVLAPIDILRSATSVNADIIGQGERLGRVETGYLADLIVLDGNPLENLSLFDEFGTKVPLVMKGGELMKSELS